MRDNDNDAEMDRVQSELIRRFREQNGRVPAPGHDVPPEQRGDCWQERYGGAGVAETALDLRLSEAEEPPPRDTWPEPMAPEAFAGIAGEIVGAIEPETEADKGAVLIQFLVAFGNLCGRRAYRPVGPRRHYGNLYACLVGRTSVARKGTAWSWVESLMALVDPDWHKECIVCGLSSGEGLISALKDESEIDRRLMAVEEEFGSALKAASRDGSILSAVLRQGWDGGRLRVMTRHNPLRATDVHISVIGHITPPELKKLLTDTDMANGFANRFLWVCCKRSKLLPDGGDTIDLDRFRSPLVQAVNYSSGTTMGRDRDARRLWHDVYGRLTAETPGILGQITSRGAAQVLRLSVLYAVLDSASEIRLPHLKSALAVWDYCRASAAWIFGDSTGDKDADELLNALRRSPDGLSLTEMSAVFGRNKPMSQIRQLLARLEEFGLVVSGQRACRGRPAGKWHATNPTNPTNPIRENNGETL